MKIQSIKENGCLKGIIRKKINKCRHAKKNPGDVFLCVCVCAVFTKSCIWMQI